MPRIGEVTRIESIKACKCMQCGEWFYYTRITSKYCSPACRKQSSRNVEPTDKYAHGILSEDERILAMIAQSSPLAFRELTYIKDHYGQRALDRAMSVVKILGIS